MNRGRLFLIARQVFASLLASAAVIVLLSTGYRVSAQTTLAQPESSHPKATVSPVTRSDAPNADNDYSKKIREYTTQPYFMTELVDHLPLSDKVPSPDKVLGYVVGTPNKLTYTKDIYRYFGELAKATPRVRIFKAPERSEDGKDQILVAVGDE